MFNLNPKKIAGMMSKLGIKQEEIPANRVIIEQESKKIIIENPSVIKINMQGQENFQISGEIKEEKGEVDKENLGSLYEQDIKTIMEKTSSTKEQAENALKQAKGDLAEAILALQ